VHVSTINFITQGNYKATSFDYRLVIRRPILSIVSQDATHTAWEGELYDDTKLDDTETFDLDIHSVFGEYGRYAELWYR